MTSIYSPYNSTSQRKELDLQEELEDFLEGSAAEVNKGKTGLLRKMRRDDDGNLTRCPCRDPITDESDKDYYCKYCLGMGWFWDETEIVYYKNEDSFREERGTYFYLKYSELVTGEDYIIEVTLDIDGNPVIPVTREKAFEITRATPFRSDNGRIEYWRVLAEYRREWSVWYGVQNRQYTSS